MLQVLELLLATSVRPINHDFIVCQCVRQIEEKLCRPFADTVQYYFQAEYYVIDAALAIDSGWLTDLFSVENLLARGMRRYCFIHRWPIQ